MVNTPIKISPIVLVEVELEMTVAQAKHRPLPILNPVRCAGLICEEVGEVMKCALDATREPVSVGQFDAHMQQARVELRQVAALAMSWLMELDKIQKGEDTK